MEINTPPLYGAIIDAVCARDEYTHKILGGKPFYRVYVAGEFWPAFTSDDTSGEVPPDVILVRRVKPGMRMRSAYSLLPNPGQVVERFKPDKTGPYSREAVARYEALCKQLKVKPGPLWPLDDRVLQEPFTNGAHRLAEDEQP